MVGLAPRENLVGVDVVQTCEPRHGGAWLQRLFDDGALEFYRVAAVRPAGGRDAGVGPNLYP